MKKSKGEKLKIAIIGAGPAGALSAYLLSKQDHQIHLYERNLKTKRKVCGEYLCPQGIDLLKKYDFYHEISGLFQLLYGMKIVTPSGIKLTTFFPNDKYGLSLNRQKFDNFLISKIDPRVQIKRGQSLVNLEKKQDQWLVKTEQDEQLFDLVIAADGIHSKVAKILGHSKKSSLERIALHVFLPLKNIRDYQRIGQMHLFQDSSYCGLDPINENEINFSIVCDSEKLKNMRPYEIINHYIHSSEKLTQMFELISENSQVSTITPLSKKNTFIAGEGIAYVGDASGFVDPLTGEGIYNALLSAEILSQNLERSSLDKALREYKLKKKKLSFQKNLLNHFFQMVIRNPWASHLIATYLERNQKRANIFIGIIGNIYSPLRGLFKLLSA